MPALESDLDHEMQADAPPTRLPFPPLKRSHILHCSYHDWHPRYRAITPKARTIPLSQPFLAYLRADGIILPPDESDPRADWSDSDSGIFSSTGNTSESDDEDEDPSREWPEVHQAIREAITELGGKIAPKMNWSAPKDATWISATNNMECRSPNDIYLLLKSSDFVVHDLEHAFDDCETNESSESANEMSSTEIPYHLVLRKWILLNPSVEFRCFVRKRRLIGICQRDLNHFDFLFNMQYKLRDKIQDFFDEKLRNTFPDEDFVFDVYIPPPHERLWLVDINPWAQRTDPLLFSWLELLTMPEPPILPSEVTVSIPIRSAQHPPEDAQSLQDLQDQTIRENVDEGSDEESDDQSEVDEDLTFPELRLVRRDDPEAYGFSTPQYSAHKLPKDVVDASQNGQGALRQFTEQWKDILAKQQREEEEEEEHAQG
ncbi:MAG: hypothetical protein M1820_003523 [Bogoriella megaspora]|nr:MAG: hypothetical protein M1820_003523 [Bogoriella megaspora]